MGFLIFWSVIAAIVLAGGVIWLLVKIGSAIYESIIKWLTIKSLERILIERLGYDKKTAHKMATHMYIDSQLNNEITYED